METNCYCGKSDKYLDCCGALHTGMRKAKTAEELMRSRYSAFVMANVDYILLTYADTTRPIGERQNILDWTKSVDWLGLEVLNTEKGNILDVEGYVEFQATYLEEGKRQKLYEKSFFQKENGCWRYVSGEYSMDEKPEKLHGRNKPCYCGSGKKYKKCCFRNK
ncbi:YchJ family protein [Ancylomarina longa]|uniref:YchJ family protein n=1 Tax=Ancylomarina longa TaxID=2487017 RepID=A0A434AZE1_9BACT|nr:YchJ family protein [Ancylomarina longa]RUT79904.1 YchJ family protein [Ancylomarina longa]